MSSIDSHVITSFISMYQTFALLITTLHSATDPLIFTIILPSVHPSIQLNHPSAAVSTCFQVFQRKLGCSADLCVSCVMCCLRVVPSRIKFSVSDYIRLSSGSKRSCQILQNKTRASTFISANGISEQFSRIPTRHVHFNQPS